MADSVPVVVASDPAGAALRRAQAELLAFLERGQLLPRPRDKTVGEILPLVRGALSVRCLALLGRLDLLAPAIEGFDRLRQQADRSQRRLAEALSEWVAESRAALSPGVKPPPLPAPPAPIPDEVRFLQAQLRDTIASGDRGQEARLFEQAAEAFAQHGQPVRAADAFERAYQALSALEDSVAAVQVLDRLATLYIEANALDRAVDAYLRARDLVERIVDMETLGVLYANLGYVHRLRGDFSAALSSYEQALGIDRGRRDLLAIAENQVSLGWVSVEAGQLAEAQRYFRAAQETFQQQRMDERVGPAYVGLGLSQPPGQEQQMRQLLEHGLHLCTAAGDQVGLAFGYRGLGDLWDRLGDAGRATDYYRRAADLFVALREWYEYAGVQAAVAAIHQRAADYRAVARLLPQAMRVFGDMGLLDRLGTLAPLLLEVCQHPDGSLEALEETLRALDAYAAARVLLSEPEAVAPARLQQAGLLARLQQRDQARAALEEARTFYTLVGDATSLGNLGKVQQSLDALDR